MVITPFLIPLRSSLCLYPLKAVKAGKVTDFSHGPQTQHMYRHAADAAGKSRADANLSQSAA
jgi:hypothetical protein